MPVPSDYHRRNRGGAVPAAGEGDGGECASLAAFLGSTTKIANGKRSVRKKGGMETQKPMASRCGRACYRGKISVHRRCSRTTSSTTLCCVRIRWVPARRPGRTRRRSPRTSAKWRPPPFCGRTGPRAKSRPGTWIAQPTFTTRCWTRWRSRLAHRRGGRPRSEQRPGHPLAEHDCWQYLCLAHERSPLPRGPAQWGPPFGPRKLLWGGAVTL